MKELLLERLQDVARSIVTWWNGQQLMVRGGLLGGAGLFLGAIVATVIVAGGSDSPGVVVATPTTIVAASGTATPTPEPATATSTPRATPSATTTGTATPEPTATAEPAIRSIDELVSNFGHPPGYNFARLRIPFIGVDAPVGASVVGGQNGALMDVPEGPATVFWYDLSAWAEFGFGGAPGEGRNAIFSGHVDLASYVPYADVNYRGPAVFADIDQLTPGDRVFIDINGESLEYVVSWKEQVNAGDSSRWGEIWNGDVAVDSITLYTCGGEFNFADASYIDRIVVRAERV